MIEIENEYIKVDGLVKFYHNYYNVYNVIDDEIYMSIEDFCKANNIINCECCLDNGYYTSESEVHCFKPVSECCGGCTRIEKIECNCEDSLFAIKLR